MKGTTALDGLVSTMLARVDEDSRHTSNCTDSFEELAAKHERMLYAVCYKELGDRQAAEDAVQESLIAAWRHGMDFHCPPTHWLIKVARNKCRDELRRRRRRPAIPLHAVLDTAFAEALSLVDPTPFLLHADDRECLVRALRQIPPKQRLAIILFDVEGLRYTEIAEMTGSPVGTIKSQISRARQRLRQMLSSLSQRRD